MPIYEYECKDCGRIVEAWQKFSDAPLTTCTHCAGKLHKVISQSAFHLKGAGWYVTDYANKDRGSSATSGGKDEVPGENRKTPKGKGEKTNVESPSSSTESSNGGG